MTIHRSKLSRYIFRIFSNFSKKFSTANDSCKCWKCSLWFASRFWYTLHNLHSKSSSINVWLISRKRFLNNLPHGTGDRWRQAIMKYADRNIQSNLKIWAMMMFLQQKKIHGWGALGDSSVELKWITMEGACLISI